MKNIVLLILLALAFCLNEFLILKMLPLAPQDYEVWKVYFVVKDAVYDAMFFVFSLVLFWNFQDRLLKSMSVFLVIVTGGSFIDKVIFDLNQYLVSDIVLIVTGIILSAVKWKTLKHGA